MDVKSILDRLQRPTRAVVTAGMPYANGPLHIGHLAGAQLPGDFHARWLGLLIGRDNVLYVCGTDDHGSTSELTAMRAGRPVSEVIGEIHALQKASMDRFNIGLDTYSGTSRPECFPRHAALCQDMIRRIYANGLFSKRTSRQWYDSAVERFLPDRMVRGQCPNPKCDNEDAYSDECDVCGHQHEPTDLISPRSAVSDATPELRDTVHLWLDMWQVSEVMKRWVETKRKSWRTLVVQQVLDTLKPSRRFAREHEETYKGFREALPKHKRKYAPGQQVVLQFETKDELAAAGEVLTENGVASEVVDEWAHRSISRDIPWGIPMPDVDPEIVGKTLYVWPDSLIAPISFSQVALEQKGLDPATWTDFWCDPQARIYQFLGQDNVFFYVLMQAALWLDSQEDPHRLPVAGELQLNDVFGCFHLLVGGAKMSKSRGNFYTGDQLLDEKGYSADQVRYYLALLGLSDKPADFDFEKLDARNAFLAGRMNAAFERPISATHSKFGGRVPEGQLIDQVEDHTARMVQRYVKAMQQANYPNMIYELENYARRINTLFNRYKPHDDRHPEGPRRDALYSAFYLLKNLMIMLYPFVPETMERLRESLRLPPTVFSVDELGTPIPAGHEVGQKQPYFPAEERTEG
jgi:methionyl-tRNA synthetase